MEKFKNKVFVITGGGEGIGKSLALELIDLGATVVINDINQKSLDKVKSSICGDNRRCFYFKADISKKLEVKAFADFVKQRFGKIDCLINNAGVSIGRLSAVEISSELNEWIFGINYWGTVHCVNNFLPLIHQNSGSKIVNVCSLFSYLSVYQRSAYCASKSALKAYTSAIRHELKSLGIDVIAVFPGMVNSKIVQNSKGWLTDMEKKAAQELQSSIAPISTEQAAHQIISGIRRNKSRIVIGLDAKLIFQLLRFLPKTGEDLVNAGIKMSENRIKRKLALRYSEQLI